MLRCYQLIKIQIIILLTGTAQAMARGNENIITLEFEDQVDYVKGSGVTTPRSYRFNSWKEIWMDRTGKQFPQTCQILDCENQGTIGAHVYVKPSAHIPSLEYRTSNEAFWFLTEEI